MPDTILYFLVGAFQSISVGISGAFRMYLHLLWYLPIYFRSLTSMNSDLYPHPQEDCLGHFSLYYNLETASKQKVEVILGITLLLFFFQELYFYVTCCPIYKKMLYLSAFSLLVKKVEQYISLVYFIMTGSNKLYFYLKF